MARSLAQLIVSFAATALVAGASPDVRVYIVTSGSDPRPVTAPAQTLSIMIGVSNMNGASDAHGVVLTVTLPGGLSFQRAGRQPDRVEGGKLRWNLGTMKAGELPHVFELNAQTGADVPAGSELLVAAEVTSSDAAGAATDNNRAAYRIHVQRAGVDLMVESSLQSVPLYPGRQATFATAVMNAGNASAPETVLAIALPPRITVKDADPKPTSSSDANVVTWALGDLPRGETRTVSVTINLDPDLAMQLDSTADSLACSFDVSSAATDTDPADNHLKIERRVQAEGHDVAVWLNIEGGPSGELTPGKDVTLVLIYANVGNEVAHKTTATLRAPAGTSLTRAQPAATRASIGDASAESVSTWELGDLRLGGHGMIRVPIRLASGPGTLVTAAISADGRDVKMGDNTARAVLRETRAGGKRTLGVSAGNVNWLLRALAAVAVLGALWLAMRWFRNRKA